MGESGNRGIVRTTLTLTQHCRPHWVSQAIGALFAQQWEDAGWNIVCVVFKPLCEPVWLDVRRESTRAGETQYTHNISDGYRFHPISDLGNHSVHW